SAGFRDTTAAQYGAAYRDRGARTYSSVQTADELHRRTDCVAALIRSESRGARRVIENKTAARAGANCVTLGAIEQQFAKRLAAIERNRAIKVYFGSSAVRHATEPIERLTPAQRNCGAVHRDGRVRKPLRFLR